MKTDKQKLEELLTEFGVEYSYVEKDDYENAENCAAIISTQNDHPYKFDKDGKFIQMGCWE